MLREVCRELKTPEKKLYTKVANNLTKIGDGKPTSRAVLKLFAKVDNDADWHPGKTEQDAPRDVFGEPKLSQTTCSEALKPTLEPPKTLLNQGRSAP